MDELLISILPFIFIVAVWIFIMFKMKKSIKAANSIGLKHDEMIDLLKEISKELKELNKNIASK
jgi:preprotein translocase subunit SecG